MKLDFLIDPEDLTTAPETLLVARAGDPTYPRADEAQAQLVARFGYPAPPIP